MSAANGGLPIASSIVWSMARRSAFRACAWSGSDLPTARPAGRRRAGATRPAPPGRPAARITRCLPRRCPRLPSAGRQIVWAGSRCGTRAALLLGRHDLEAHAMAAPRFAHECVRRRLAHRGGGDGGAARPPRSRPRWPYPSQCLGDCCIGAFAEAPLAGYSPRPRRVISRSSSSTRYVPSGCTSATTRRIELVPMSIAASGEGGRLSRRFRRG